MLYALVEADQYPFNQGIRDYAKMVNLTTPLFAEQLHIFNSNFHSNNAQ